MKTKFFLIIAVAGMCGVPVAHAQGGGSLTPPPPGIPAPSMKSLDQIDPGTPLDPAQFPATGYVITQPGFYYLTGNVTAITATESAIIINASDVTLDLRGFSIIAASGTAATAVDSAIYAGSQSNITVRNGSIVGKWYAAIYTVGANCSAEDLRVSRMTTYGLRLDDGARIIHCSVEGSGLPGGITLYGISAGTHSLIKDCTAALCDGDGINAGAYSALLDSVAFNNTSDGIEGGNGCVLSRCTAAQNTGRGLVVFDGATVAECASHNNGGAGIVVDVASSVSRSSADLNGGAGFTAALYGSFADCTAASNTAEGFLADLGSTLHNCSASANESDGFHLNEGSVAVTCTAHSNGQATTNAAADGFEIPVRVRLGNCLSSRNRGAGVRATGGENYIEGGVIRLNSGGGIVMPNSVLSLVICNRVDAITPAPIGTIGPFNNAYTTKPFSNF